MIDPNASVFDQRSLARLRGTGDSDSDGALGHAASEFEALFLRMMFKSMRDAMPTASLDGSTQRRDYQDMHDAQLAAHLARGGGIGLADVIARQVRPPIRATAPTTGALKAYQVVESQEASSNTDPQQAFVDAVRPHAEAAAAKLGTTPETLIAQAALETGWGRSLPESNGRSSHNYFGVKVGRNWTGHSVTSKTFEFGPNGRESVRASFRRYDRASDSFADYARLIMGSKRYANAVGSQGQEYYRALAAGGYATDPDYVAKATAIHDRLKSPAPTPIAEPPPLRYAGVAVATGGY